jgi:hypothetical protein
VVASRVPRRVAILAIVVTAIATIWATAGAGASTAPAAGTATRIGGAATSPAERAAEQAIDDITARPGTVDPLAGIPDDFPRVMGYRPTRARLANGEVVAINPNGGCSVVGGGRPFDLDTVCKAHDLGYDLLRYAHRHGENLDAFARRQVDDKFDADLAAQCAARYTGAESSACYLMAGSFDLGVGFNSWRQMFGPPVASSGMVRTVGTIALVLLGIYFALRGLLRKAIRRRPSLSPSPWRRRARRRLGSIT